MADESPLRARACGRLSLSLASVNVVFVRSLVGCWGRGWVGGGRGRDRTYRHGTGLAFAIHRTRAEARR